MSVFLRSVLPPDVLNTFFLNRKVSASIPAYELNIDTNKDEFEVTVEFEYCPADREVGIMSDSMEYSGWDTKERLTSEEEDAIDSYLYSHADDLYGEVAYEKLCDYADYMREMRHDRW